MTRDFRDYLADIAKCIESIESFTIGMTYDEFVRDEKTVWAVIRGLEIIGEAVSQLPDELKEKHPHIPWRDIRGMRNKLIHEYFGVNVRVLWVTIQEKIPAIKPHFIELSKNS
ncbi:MAG: DUF86 domain-containing protein [Bacteroidetes bacterium]|nr:MAG: DUF86 domain-containing protein [Bacteroidota bacterium]